MKNNLIVFEGIDGVGKTTLSKLLQEKLINQGVKAIRYEDIEKKDGGFNQIKPFIKTQTPIDSSLLFYLSSAIYKSQQIEELLNHSWVICDRYIYSTLSYHTIRDANVSLIPDVDKMPIRQPDFLFLIKVDEEIRLKRVKARSHNNPDDFKVKKDTNLVGKMEKELERFNPNIIDNSPLDPLNALESIYTIIKD